MNKSVLNRVPFSILITALFLYVLIFNTYNTITYQLSQSDRQKGYTTLFKVDIYIFSTLKIALLSISMINALPLLK